MIKDYMAIINLEENESDIRSLTANRPIASIPVGSRYRVIDFMLSNIVNCGITNVGIFTKSNSRSLIDHIGTGKPWDLNRKIDGLFMFNHALSEFVNTDSKLLKNNMEYMFRSKSQNVILTSSYMVCNMDLREVVRNHEASGCDMTVVYTKCKKASEDFINCYTLDVDEQTGRVKAVGKNIGYEDEANICMEVFLMKKEKLVNFMYKSANRTTGGSFYSMIFDDLEHMTVNAYEFKGYVSCINTVSSYYKTNKEMLDLEVSNELFRSDRPVFTKIKDEPPTLYVEGCHVSNSLIADGCKIMGTVKDSLLGRYVDVEEGAVVEDCIILQNIRIHKGAKLSHVIIDKNVDIEQNTELKGNSVFPLVIEKRNIFK